MLCFDFSLTPEQLKLHDAMNLTFHDFFEYLMKTAKKHLGICDTLDLVKDI